MSGRALYEKFWDAHVISQHDDGMSLVYLDRHLIMRSRRLSRSKLCERRTTDCAGANFRKHCLLNGLDEISFTEQSEADTAAFERECETRVPRMRPTHRVTP